MPTPQQLINDISDKAESAINRWSSQLPGVQKSMLDEVLILVDQLEKTGGNLKQSVGNLRILQQIEQRLKDAILTDSYSSAIADYGSTFDEITDLNNKYYAEIITGFSRPEFISATRQVAIQDVVSSLTAEGLTANVINPIREIIKTNIESGGSFIDLTNQLKNEVVGTSESAGLLTRYSKTYVNDALYEYANSYHNIMSDVEGFEWFEYVGALVQDSRDFCEKLVAKRWFHKSEIQGFLSGRVGGSSVPLYKKTGKPFGMKSSTTVKNFPQLRGGWGCKHMAIAVNSNFVPKEVREKFAK